jgi:hypothetical protein
LDGYRAATKRRSLWATAATPSPWRT